MKKFLVMVAVAIMAAVNVNAQSDEPRHEVGVSYGVGASAIIDGLSNAFSNGLFDGIQGLKWKDSNSMWNSPMWKSSTRICRDGSLPMRAT